MSSASQWIVLGSRSPQRRELLTLLVGTERVLVRPPHDPGEPGFEDVSDFEDLRRRIIELARLKCDDVVAQLRVDGALAGVAAVVTADTVIVGIHPDGRPAVLGQPPTADDWQQTVRDWFHRFLLGRTHQAMTAVCVTTPDGTRAQQVVTTDVHFCDAGDEWLEWYLATGEPLGKAGGYGLQGAGGLFVDRIMGSPSNVIGLPLKETAAMLQRVGVRVTITPRDPPED